MSRPLRTLHFALTILVGLPLVAWTVTGFAFTCFDFDSVRGTRDRAPEVELTASKVDIARAIEAARARRAPGARVIEVRARMLLGRPCQIVEFAPPDDALLVDGESGEARDAITAEEAREIARRAFRGEARVLETSLVTSERDAPGVREAAYRVMLGDPNGTQIFVARRTGEILSWRNDAWRRFDRLWSLHVFAFIDRTSPAQWPLRIAGALAALASLSGAALLLAVLARRVTSRRRAEVP